MGVAHRNEFIGVRKWKLELDRRLKLSDLPSGSQPAYFIKLWAGKWLSRISLYAVPMMVLSITFTKTILEVPHEFRFNLVGLYFGRMDFNK